MHVIADSMIGIGFHSVLCLWLCLCEGLRYHTAKAARKRAGHQKQILELRRATKALAESGVSRYSACESPSDYLTSYYDEFGDMDNSGPSAYMNLRLKHDPCGDGWADFLLPKMFLFILGACAVVVTSLFRFSCSAIDDESILDGVLSGSATGSIFTRKVFIVSSITQLAILALWAVLIVRAALKTGAQLRKEPFLSTRPAQLAFRIMMSILVLEIVSFLLPLSADMISLFEAVSTERNVGSPSSLGHGGDGLVYKTSSDYYVGSTTGSLTDVLMKIVVHASQRFPYSGTAASLGPGEILYVTTGEKLRYTNYSYIIIGILSSPSRHSSYSGCGLHFLAFLIIHHGGSPRKWIVSSKTQRESTQR